MPDGMGRVDDAPRTEHASGPPGQAVVLAGHLRAAARHAAGATERRNTIPILSYLLLQAEGGTLTVQGTNMDELVTATAPARGDLPRVTVPALRTAVLLARLPDETEITLRPEPDLGGVRLSAPGLRAVLMALPADDFPTIRDGFKPVARFAIPVPSLRRLVTLPGHAISTEETRYYLNGLYLARREAGEETLLSATATDGHRLVRVDEPLPAGAGRLPGLIVPRKTVARIRALLDARATGEVQVEASDTKVRFQVGHVSIFSKVIDGTFPDIDRVIPRDVDATATIRVLQPVRFREAIETAAAISDERSRPVKFQGETGAIRLSSASPEMGTAEVDLPPEVATWEGLPREIGFQARYLAALARILPEGFTARIADHSAPMRIDFPRGVAVLMPMRV